MPERPYRGRDVQNKAYTPPRIHFPFRSVNRGVPELNEPRPGRGLPPVARGAVLREKLDDNSSKCIRLFYVRRVPTLGEDLLVVATAARRVLVEDGADLGDHRLGWVDLFPWPVRHHTDFPEVGEICGLGVRDCPIIGTTHPQHIRPRFDRCERAQIAIFR
jgi:hypothetical protein